MDPTATWQLLCEQLRDGDLVAAHEAATDLLAWLDRGGFPPTITGVRAIDFDMARRVCQAVYSARMCATCGAVQTR